MASLLNFLGIDSRRSSVTLVEYKYDPEAREKVSKYLVRHTSSFRGTTLEQYVTVERDRYGAFKPVVALDDFPSGMSEQGVNAETGRLAASPGVAIEDEWSTP